MNLRNTLPLLASVVLVANASADPRVDLIDRVIRVELLEQPQGSLLPPPVRLPELLNLSQEAPSVRLARLWGVTKYTQQLLLRVPQMERGVIVELAWAAQRIARRYPKNHGIFRELDWDGLALVAQYGDGVADGVAWLGKEYKVIVKHHGQHALTYFEQCVRPDPSGFLKNNWKVYRRDPLTFHARLDNQHPDNVHRRNITEQIPPVVAWISLISGSVIFVAQLFWLPRRSLAHSVSSKGAAPPLTYFRE